MYSLTVGQLHTFANNITAIIRTSLKICTVWSISVVRNFGLSHTHIAGPAQGSFWRSRPMKNDRGRHSQHAVNVTRANTLSTLWWWLILLRLNAIYGRQGNDHGFYSLYWIWLYIMWFKTTQGSKHIEAFNVEYIQQGYLH